MKVINTIKNYFIEFINKEIDDYNYYDVSTFVGLCLVLLVIIAFI